jgi:lipid-binding SYLF domain-containing protein
VLPAACKAATKTEIDRDAAAALEKLYATSPAARELRDKAVAILVFPHVVKAGLMLGGQFGEGVLIVGGEPVGYYSTAGASFGMQAGAQRYGYAMFFMSRAALVEIDKAKGFEIGVGPSVVVMDEGMAKQTTTRTLKDDIYAFIFGQKGLMAGLGIQGNKITKIER